MDALAFLKDKKTKAEFPIYVVAGDDVFLRSQAIQKLKTILVPAKELDNALTTFAGDTANYSEVKNELDTLPFLASKRIVLVENADPFISNYRPQLETFAGSERKAKSVLDG